MRTKLAAALVATAAILSTTAFERDARACGGCFHPPPSPTEQPTLVTGHRMILSISMQQSTLYDQIKYSGNPASFAWVLPISGTVDIGLSSNKVFTTLDAFTTTSIIAPPMNCPAPPTCNSRGGGGFSSSSDVPSSAGASEDASTAPRPPVTVTKEEQVGPYETVQLHSTDANALQSWLATNGFSIPADVQPIINKYVTEKFDFLALKLLPGKDVTDMRPVRVTTQGASAVLPLRMVSAGTGATVGIELWVVGEGRYEPQNFPSFAFTADDLAWDWTQNRSNYTDLRAQKATDLQGKGWETESSILLSRPQIESQLVNNYYPQNPGPIDPDAGPPLDPAEQAAQLDYAPVKDAQGNVTKTAVQVREEDLAALFHGIDTASSRVTRLRSDLAHAALSVDLVMTASKDQAVLSNIRQLTKELNQPLCPVYSPDGCSQIGQAPRDEAAARNSGSGDETFSCATGGPAGDSSAWFGAALGYLAYGVIRSRRRRSSK